LFFRIFFEFFYFYMGGSFPAFTQINLRLYVQALLRKQALLFFPGVFFYPPAVNNLLELSALAIHGVDQVHVFFQGLVGGFPFFPGGIPFGSFFL
jgi:hypothetical protein